MKKHFFTSVVLLFSFAAFAQKSHTKSEKTSLSIHNNDTELLIKSSFPMDRAANFQNTLIATLGKATKTVDNESQWISDYYTASFSLTRFRAQLNKKKATTEQTKLFEDLANHLQAALAQPSPPTPPKLPKG